ncbi:MAG: hypothetical protein F6K65_23530 [Moorea sp. SIO3C2]|nr:hypothetical protein [Moorena sp. SIO3C2]
MIPTRTSQTVEWSIDKAHPHGIIHHYFPLALLRCDGSKWELLEDRRALGLGSSRFGQKTPDRKL